MLNKNVKLNFRLGNIMQAGFGIAIADGGFVIAVQIINFLLVYFGTHFPADAENLQGIVAINKVSFLIAIITMINLSVIIYRIAGLSRGMKYSAAVCYQQALRRGPMLILLYLLGTALMIILTMPLTRIMQNPNLLMFLMLSCIPIGILSCIYVVDQEKNPLQAIVATFNTITNKISINLLMNIALLYSLPFCLGTMFTAPTLIIPYISLLNAIWFLFCHILTIIVYAGTCIKLEINPDNKNPTKVIII